MNRGMVRGESPFELSADGRDAESDIGIVLRESSDFNSVNALIEAINRGFESAILGLGNMQHEMQNGIPRLERAGPIAFQSGRTMRRLCLVIRLRLSVGCWGENYGYK